jgi:orotidine-5'-phosphate decarboxylase
MLAIAAEEAQSVSEPPLILAVTALTSLASEDIHALGVGGSAEDWVKRLAELAYDSGIRGLVASSKELPVLRRTYQDKMKLVIPGIRPAGSEQQDQSRVSTPGEAILAGADFIVVGRPILKNANPAGAADAIVSEIQQALLSKNAKPQ